MIRYLVLCSLLSLAGPVAAQDVDPDLDARKAAMCDGQGSMWMSALREAWGEHASCTADVAMEFEGRTWLEARYDWKAGHTYHIETLPIETAIRTVSPAGAEATPEFIETLVASVRDAGFEPDMSTDSDEAPLVEVYWDPDEGRNAQVRITRNTDGRIVEVVFSYAL